MLFHVIESTMHIGLTPSFVTISSDVLREILGSEKLQSKVDLNGGSADAIPYV